MTAKELTTAAAKSHWPNLLMFIAGAGLLAFGWLKPGESDELISKVVEFIGYALAGGGGLNAMRVGAKKEAEQLPDAVAGKILDRLAVVQYLGDENKESVAALLKTVNDNRATCETQGRKLDDLAGVCSNLAGHMQAHSHWIQQADKNYVPPLAEIKTVPRTT